MTEAGDIIGRPACGGPSGIVLGGDIGGTHARLGLARLERERGAETLRVLARSAAPVAGSSGLEVPLSAFLEAQAARGLRPARACLGVAGTVCGRRVQGVNLPWSIDADLLERAFGFPFDLVNDFQAAAAGIEVLDRARLHPLGGGTPDPSGPAAVLGAGTGLGQAYLVSVPGGGRMIVPGEGGHRGFAPRTPLQDRLLWFLRRRLGGRVSTERVLSGPGLLAIYEFLVEAEGLPASPSVQGAPADLASRAVSSQGLARAHPACEAALRLFVEVYGAEAGDAALTVLARGGVYLAGGIAPRVLTDPEHGAVFRAAFDDKGRFRAWVSTVPVLVVLDEDLGLLGAASQAARNAAGRAG